MPCEMLILCGQVEKVEGRKSGVCGLIRVCVCVCVRLCMWESGCKQTHVGGLG